jgi:hypothetical protein
VYNSVGVIDGDAISRLGLVVNLTKHIQVGDPGPPPPRPSRGVVYLTARAPAATAPCVAVWVPPLARCNAHVHVGVVPVAQVRSTAEVAGAASGSDQADPEEAGAWRFLVFSHPCARCWSGWQPCSAAQSCMESSSTHPSPAAARLLAELFPNFMWVVRDFGVKLERNGVKMSSREYLEDALKSEAGVSEATEQKNAVRTVLRRFFPQRDCMTMVGVPGCLRARCCAQ